MLGDSGFGITPHMITPYSESEVAYDPRRGYFNYNLSSARVRIEQVFGVAKRVFPYLAYPRQCKNFGKHTDIVKALLVLYNIFIDISEINTNNIRATVNNYCTNSTIESYINEAEELHREHWVNGGYNIRNISDNTIRTHGQRRRNELVNEFIYY